MWATFFKALFKSKIARAAAQAALEAVVTEKLGKKDAPQTNDAP